MESWDTKRKLSLIFDQVHQAFQLVTKEKQVEETDNFSFYCERTLIDHYEKVKAIVLMSYSAVLFVTL